MSFGPDTGPYPVPSAYCGESSAKMLRVPTLKDRLDQAVAQAESQLADAKEAREIFDRNPDLERLLNLMQKGRF